MLETDLYPPVKALLEGQGYAVKGEVRGCDLVAVKPGAEPVIVELKTAFGLPLLLQGVARAQLSDAVYLAFPAPRAGAGVWRTRRREILSLCRRLGIGLITVPLRADGTLGAAVPELDPAPYAPRKSARRRALLLREFARRQGDPTPGGGAKRPIMTAYRQEALLCADALATADAPMRAAEVAAAARVAGAGRILQRDVYGWFVREARGVYALSPAGRAALSAHAETVAALRAAAAAAA